VSLKNIVSGDTDTAVASLTGKIIKNNLDVFERRDFLQNDILFIRTSKFDEVFGCS